MNQLIEYEQDPECIEDLLALVLEADAYQEPLPPIVQDWFIQGVKDHVLTGYSLDKCMALSKHGGNQPRVQYLNRELNRALRTAAAVLSQDYGDWSAAIRISQDIHSGFHVGCEASDDSYRQAIYIAVNMIDRIGSGYQPRSIYNRLKELA